MKDLKNYQFDFILRRVGNRLFFCGHPFEDKNKAKSCDG